MKPAVAIARPPLPPSRAQPVCLGPTSVLTSGATAWAAYTLLLRALLGRRFLQMRAIAEAGGIPLLANVLVSASSNVKEMAAAATLCSLAAHAVSQLAEGNKENQHAIAEAGAIQPLVAMLGSPNPEQQANAALALCELSSNNPPNQGAVARTGAIAPLCTLVREGARRCRWRDGTLLCGAPRNSFRSDAKTAAASAPGPPQI